MNVLKSLMTLSIKTTRFAAGLAIKAVKAGYNQLSSSSFSSVTAPDGSPHSLASALSLANAESRFLVVVIDPTDDPATLRYQISRHLGDKGYFNIYFASSKTGQRECSKLVPGLRFTSSSTPSMFVASPSGRTGSSGTLLAQHCGGWVMLLLAIADQSGRRGNLCQIFNISPT